MKFTLEIDMDRLRVDDKIEALIAQLIGVVVQISRTNEPNGSIVETKPYDVIGEYGVDRVLSFGSDGGTISIEQPMSMAIFQGALGVSVATDGRIWICIDGAAALRFNPKRLMYRGEEENETLPEG